MFVGCAGWRRQTRSFVPRVCMMTPHCSPPHCFMPSSAAARQVATATSLATHPPPMPQSASPRVSHGGHTKLCTGTHQASETAQKTKALPSKTFTEHSRRGRVLLFALPTLLAPLYAPAVGHPNHQAPCMAQQLLNRHKFVSAALGNDLGNCQLLGLLLHLHTTKCLGQHQLLVAAPLSSTAHRSSARCET